MSSLPWLAVSRPGLLAASCLIVLGGCVDELPTVGAKGSSFPDTSGSLDDVSGGDGNTFTPMSPDIVLVDLGPFEWKPDDETLPVFEQGVVKTLEITMSDSELKGLLDCWRDPPEAVANETEKCWFTCTATFEGKTSEPAACRPKGRPSKWSYQKKPQWIIRFDDANEDARFFGLRRFNLESNSSVLAPVRDRLGMWFMREAGIPASRVALMLLTVNGQPYGPYQNIEPIDKEYLEDRFANPEGNLYDDEEQLATNKKTGTDARFREYLEVVDNAHSNLERSHAAFFASVAGLIDVDAFMRLVAAEAVLATADNFSDGAGNTYFYDQYPGPGIQPLPWDHDELFDAKYTFPDEPIGTCLSEDFSSGAQELCEVLWSDAQSRAWLLAEMRRLRDEVMARLPAELAKYCDEARPYVLADPFASDDIADDFAEDCGQIEAWVEARIEFLAAQEELE